MKKTILAITLCLFTLCLALKTPAYCQGITKIGYVNVATLLASSKNLKIIGVVI